MNSLKNKSLAYSSFYILKDVMLPVIFGIASLDLSQEEEEFLAHNSIFGVILFARNVESKEQLIALNEKIRKKSLNKDIFILIDEEGGKVSRLDKIFPRLKSARDIGLEGDDAVRTTYQEMARRLKELGINMVCAPVADLFHENTHDIIGNRAFGSEANEVAKFCRIACETLLKNDIQPVLKHIPGHGRSLADSHEELPVIEEDLEILEQTDFKVFKNLNDMPFAMTAHILYPSLDSNLPATLSPIIIKYLREKIGFKGVIMSDDINMKALNNYSITEITKMSLNAGCDLILHCNGDIKEMQEITAYLKK